jgi:hypothetical protein
MGVERAVTRWYVQRQQVTNEIVLLQSKLALSDNPHDGDRQDLEHESPDVRGLKQELARAQEKLHLLGPCPKPMMG